MLAAECDVIEQLDAAHKTNLMHSQIRLVTGRKHGSNPTTYYLGGMNMSVTSKMTTEVICQKMLRM